MGGVTDMFSGDSGSSSQTNEAYFNATLEPYMKDILKRGKTLSNEEYVPYEGDRVAGLTPDQLAAQQAVQNQQGQYQGVFDQSLGQYGDIYQQAMGNTQLDQNRIGELMNPYTQQVIDTSKTNAIDDYQRSMSGIGDQAVNMGAFGGSRQGVMEGMATQGLYDTLADIQYQGMSDAYGNAQNLATQEMGLQNQALGLAGSSVGQQIGAAGAGQSYGLQDANALNYYGSQQQGINQAGLDVQYEDFLAEQEDPYTKLSWMNSLTQPYTQMSMGGTSDAGGTESSGSSMGNILGAATSIYSMSDERVKENISEVGKLDNGLTVYKYNYKGQETPQIGLLAQEVEKDNPNAVKENSEGVKMVNYNAAVEKLNNGGLIGSQSPQRGQGLKDLIASAPQLSGGTGPQYADLSNSSSGGGSSDMLGSLLGGGGGEGGGGLGDMLGSLMGGSGLGSFGGSQADADAAANSEGITWNQDKAGSSAGFSGNPVVSEDGGFLPDSESDWLKTAGNAGLMMFGLPPMFNNGGLVDFGSYNDGGYFSNLKVDSKDAYEGFMDLLQGPLSPSELGRAPSERTPPTYEERQPGESYLEMLGREGGNAVRGATSDLADVLTLPARAIPKAGEFLADTVAAGESTFTKPVFTDEDVLDKTVSPNELVEKSLSNPAAYDQLKKKLTKMNREYNEELLARKEEGSKGSKGVEVSTVEEAQKQTARAQQPEIIRKALAKTNLQQPTNVQSAAGPSLTPDQLMNLLNARQGVTEQPQKKEGTGLIKDEALFNLGMAMMTSKGDIFDQVGAGGKAYLATHKVKEEQDRKDRELQVKQHLAQQKQQNTQVDQRIAQQKADAYTSAQRSKLGANQGISKAAQKAGELAVKSATDLAITNNTELSPEALTEIYLATVRKVDGMGKFQQEQPLEVPLPTDLFN